MAYDPTGAIVRNLFTLQGLGNGVTAEVRALLVDLFDEIVSEIAKSDPVAGASLVWKRKRVEDLLAKIKEKTGPAFESINKLVRQQVAQVGSQQAQWAVAQLKKSITSEIDIAISRGEVSLNLAKAIIDNNPIVGELMGTSFDEMERRVLANVRRQIQIGMAQSETTDEIVHRVRGSAISGEPGEFFGGVLESTTREATAVVRTAVNDISNVAHLSTWQANSDVVSKWRFVATLDARTCPQCAALDGQEFDLSDTANRPPLHWNDRCVSVPVIDWKSLGIDPPAESTRASADGQVPASTVYEDWLLSQSKSEQDKILGPGRAELFRDGKVTLRELVRGDGRVVRLADLL